jgi:hypothetical protein
MIGQLEQFKHSDIVVFEWIDLETGLRKGIIGSYGTAKLFNLDEKLRLANLEERKLYIKNYGN